MFTGPLAAAAAYAKRLQAASCVITRSGGEGTFDPETGQVTDPQPVEVYDGPCQVLPTGADRVVDFAEQPTSLRQYDVTLTGLAEDVRVEDTVTVASTADSRLDGMTLRVLDVKKSSLPTNRRLACEEVIA